MTIAMAMHRAMMVVDSPIAEGERTCDYHRNMNSAAPLCGKVEGVRQCRYERCVSVCVGEHTSISDSCILVYSSTLRWWCIRNSGSCYGETQQSY